MKETIKVLIVDDSAVIRDAILNTLESEEGIKVIGTATNGKEAIDLIPELKPDIITMDIVMPIMDGLTATEHIMAYHPTPILVITSLLPQDMKIAFKALNAGAVDVVERPTISELSKPTSKIRKQLIDKVKLFANIKVITHLGGRLPKKEDVRPVRQVGPVGHSFKIVSIASSTGGPKTVRKILAKLPKDFSMPVVIVQHISAGFTKGLVDWWNNECAIEIKEGKDGEKLCPGVVYVAPSYVHMLVTREEKIKLEDTPPVGGHKPAGNVLLSSVAKVYGQSAIGIILTGMGDDGAMGIKAIKEAGGWTIAEDEASCAIFGMPKVAIEMGVIDKVLSLDAISDELMRRASGV
ncbi:MAG: chemotaxis response regulator protein-glutamate methylesterase [bacterium]|nr:chemotaxis response regulator protein-glutamate methylesterase [bacterium]